ncbi:MAG: DUF1330 domain-containing protein, partial [Candidatus Methylomirabilis sp.]|nr:DUF1330 domain-containing protein [Deltaproteobacteria bacterium]
MPGPIDYAKMRDLWRRDLAAPVDVPNLIWMKDVGEYAKYALAVYPILRAAGGRPLWMGSLAREYAGRKAPDAFMVVRYPNQRRFLAMIANPYYRAVNRFRERGVAYFEASYCWSPEADARLADHAWLLALHFNAEDAAHALADARAAVEKAGGAFAYSASEQATCSFLRRFRPTDPNPLAHKHLALFAFESRDAA